MTSQSFSYRKTCCLIFICSMIIQIPMPFGKIVLTLKCQSQLLSYALLSACDFKSHFCKQRGPRSDCSFREQSDQGPHCLPVCMCPFVRDLHVSFCLAYSRISHEYSSLFIIVIRFHVFALMHWLSWESLRKLNFLCISVLRVASGPRVKLASSKGALNPQWFILLTVLRQWSQCWSYSLLLCGLFYEEICFMSYLVLFCSGVFQSF